MKPTRYLTMAALFLYGCGGEACNGGTCVAPPVPQQAKFANFGSGLRLTASTVAGSTYTFDSSSSTISIERTNGYTGAVRVGTYAYGPTGALIACTALSVGTVSPQLTFTATAVSLGSCTITLNAGDDPSDSVTVNVPPSPAPGT